MVANFTYKRMSITTMRAKNQAFAIFPTPLISHYPLPINPECTFSSVMIRSEAVSAGEMCEARLRQVPLLFKVRRFFFLTFSTRDTRKIEILGGRKSSHSWLRSATLYFKFSTPSTMPTVILPSPPTLQCSKL
jgi:hypothetical protein